MTIVPLTIAGTNLRRTVRVRTNLFFLVLFPMLLILVLGLAFGGKNAPRLGVVAGQGRLAHQLMASLRTERGVQVQRYGAATDALGAVEAGRLEGALVIPPGYDTSLLAGQGVSLRYVTRSDRTAQQLGTLVSAAVGRQSSRLTAARVIQRHLASDLTGALILGDAVAATVPVVEVRTSTAGRALFPEDLGRFDLGASGELLLFIFITSMTASSALIESRKLGVSRRMYATPTPVGAIVAGEALGRIAVAVLQGAIIMVGSAVLFGVSWGSPVAAAALMLAFAVTAGGAALLMGAIATSTEQAIALGLLLAIGMGALGGSMMPLELFSPTVYTVAHITPHAWAADGFAELVRHHGGLVDVLPEIAVLVGYAAALFSVAAWALRRTMVRP
ncbi:MAG TPA: ABC transporter permease [Nocardioidaceae bacterium]|nr:ABC transporter permease [Nocardioidaceae bacterium]